MSIPSGERWSGTKPYWTMAPLSWLRFPPSGTSGSIVGHESAVDVVQKNERRRWRFAIGGFGAALFFLVLDFIGAPVIRDVGIALAGLALDIAGALLLAVGLVIDEWILVVLGSSGPDESARAHWGETRRDGWLAAWMLVLGFGLQMAGAIHASVVALP